MLINSLLIKKVYNVFSITFLSFKK